METIQQIVKKEIKPVQYQLNSGQTIIIQSQTVKQLAVFLGCSLAYLYQNKSRDTNKDGSWSFNYLDKNYTITKI